MARLVAVALILGVSVACTGGPAECGPEECARFLPPGGGPGPGGNGPRNPDAPPTPPTPTGTVMSPFEEGLFGPMISDVREGVRAWSGSSVGICKGSGRDCTDYVGTDVAELAPGEYMVRAELRVPEAGEKGTWKVRFQTNCEVVKTSSSGSTSKTTNTTDKEYEVQYAGDEHGSRLSPLQTIKSPSPYGEQTCTYTLTPNHGSPMTGSWKVPAAK